MSGAKDDLQRRVLVTGGAGFAGSYVICELCSRGHSVMCFDLADFRAESRFVLGRWASEVAFERGSIEDWPRVLEVVLAYRPQTIVHAGGVMDTAFLDRHQTVALRTNVGGTLNLLEAARLIGDVDRFIFFSTIGVIGWIDDMGAWMRSATAALRGGGKLLLVDLHPMYTMLESADPLRIDFPYANDGPRAFDEPGSYAGADLDVAATAMVQYGHSLAEIVNAT